LAADRDRKTPYPANKTLQTCLPVPKQTHQGNIIQRTPGYPETSSGCRAAYLILL